MPVLLIVEREIDGATAASTHPVSTEEVFNAIWLQGAEKIGAQWIPLFSSGVPLDMTYPLSAMIANPPELGLDRIAKSGSRIRAHPNRNDH